MAVAAPRTERFVRAEPDDALVARARASDQVAFEAIYDRYARQLLSFCRHMLGDQEEAEDAVQHTFLAAHRALLADERDIHLKAWLFAIARNRCLSVLRARRDEVGLDDDLPAASTAGLAAEVERREDLREMLADLGRLPPDQRAALLLAEISSHTHDEIAEVIGVKREKVKALVFQAREGLGALRAARAAPCTEIREEIANARGGALRRGTLRRHLEICDGCRAFRREVLRQRAALHVILPVAPSVALKQTVLAGVLGAGGGAAAAAGGGGLAGTGALAGAAGVGAAGVGAAGGLKAVLGKALITSAVAVGAGGASVVGVREIDTHHAQAPVSATTAKHTATQARTPLPAPKRHAVVAAAPVSPAQSHPRRSQSAPADNPAAGHRRPARDNTPTVTPTTPAVAPTTISTVPATPAPAAPAPAADGGQDQGKHPGKDKAGKGPDAKGLPPGQAKKQQPAPAAPPAVAPAVTPDLPPIGDEANKIKDKGKQGGGKDENQQGADPGQGGDQGGNAGGDQGGNGGGDQGGNGGGD